MSKGSGVRWKNFGGRGFKIMAGLGGGQAGGAPRTPKNVRKVAKIFLKKIEKMLYFSLFFNKNFKTMR